MVVQGRLGDKFDALTLGKGDEFDKYKKSHRCEDDMFDAKSQLCSTIDGFDAQKRKVNDTYSHMFLIGTSIASGRWLCVDPRMGTKKTCV